jgi:histidinol dehydrogenase
MDTSSLQEKIRTIIQEVRIGGDAAIRKFTAQFDGVDIDALAVSASEIAGGAGRVSPALKKAIDQAAANIRKFHASQVTPVEVIETMPGVRCWRKSVGIEKVGLYIPGGSAPLFSTVLMLAIPAGIAGCREIVLCTPPSRDRSIHPAILYAAQITGIEKIFRVGGVQAIAAMAYGSETIPAVYKIFGPGNQYVNCAKLLVQTDGIAIDMPAGPSEVCVLADETANPAFIAADLLSQAEHGPDSQVLLVSNSEGLVSRVRTEISTQLSALPRKQVAEQALENSHAVVLADTGSAIDLVNMYAAEHLIIARADALAIADRIVNAGSVFLGNYSPESAGDYASGTNHTLPTNGYARSYSGVSVDSFVKKITYQQISSEGLQRIGSTVEAMAEAEGLVAHQQAISIRTNYQS